MTRLEEVYVTIPVGDQQAMLFGPQEYTGISRVLSDHRLMVAARMPSYILYNIKYTTTPVTLTYSQIGSVQRAILRCLSNFRASARLSVIIASTGTVAASTVCVARMLR